MLMLSKNIIQSVICKIKQNFCDINKNMFQVLLEKC